MNSNCNESNIIDFYLNINKLKENYDKFSAIGPIYYPLKTNSNDEVIKQLMRLYGNSENGFLVTHISHYNKLIRLGVTPDKMCLVNVITNDNTIKFLYESGVKYYTFDNIKTLNNFLSYADVNDIKIAIRLNIFEAFGVFSHLGATCEECKEMLDVLKKKNVKDYGISFYLQKETLPKGNVLDKMLDYIKNNFNNYQMHFLNIGGAVRPDDINIEKLNQVKNILGAEKIILEPGRYLIGNAGYMETKIIKQKSSNVFIIRNGIYAGLVDVLLYHKKFDFYLEANSGLVQLRYEPFDNSREFIICGASSDSGDRMGKFYIEDKYYSDLKEGASIIVDNALAYVEEFFMPLGGDLIKQYHIID